jgi:ABC-type cobalamin/Fe3+-siderophores transport system ATPase subunit
MATLIHSLETTSGFLERRTVSFLPGLNCIIGARGTCKSTIVETLRFAFLQDSSRDAHLLGEPHERLSSGEDLQSLPGGGIISATLVPGSVIVNLSADGNKYTIERDTRPSPVTRVYKDGVPWSEPGMVLRQVEIYSQGELYLIAKDASRRITLVDRPFADDIARLRQDHASLVSRIAGIGRLVREKRLEISKRKAATAQLPQLREALEQIQREKPTGDDQLQLEHERFLERERLRERLEAAVRETEHHIESVMRHLGSINEHSALIDELTRSASPEARKAAAFLKHAAEAKSTASESFAALSETSINVEVLRSQFAEESATYYALREEAKERQESLKKEAAYREEIARYERLVEEYEREERDVQALLAERDGKRVQAEAILSRIFELRTTEIDRINGQFHRRILLTLQPSADFPPFRNKIRALLQGSNLRDQEAIASQLTQVFSPQQIVRTVEAQDAPHVAELLGRDLAQVNRLLSHLADHINLYDLEELVADDVLEITLYDKGKPKGMSELSKGQMATALLPLILREDSCPLVIDQPEDDLDNSFIFETLVRLVADLKKTRQLIFVTHNANLPVLGEAENVIVMEMDGPTRAGAPQSGTVDQQKESILNLLEGGETAFQARAARYDFKIPAH